MKIKVGDSLDNIKLTSIDDKIFELKKVLGSKISNQGEPLRAEKNEE